jgi:hypothetical protein
MAHNEPDEVWVAQDGTEFLVGELTEEQAKNALRELLKRARLDYENFAVNILPTLQEAIEEEFGLEGTDFEVHFHRVSMSAPEPEPGIRSDKDIDDIFLKHGASLNKS